MCGIAGFVWSKQHTNKESERLILRMLNTISYRGPDQTGYTVCGKTVLGMNRLNIVDLKNDAIPYTDSSENFFLVYNGEIYNHKDIRKNLKYLFSTLSDAETVLANFIHKGVASFSDYNGMYAFSLYDKRKDVLYLVRDKTGEKPLYYSQKNEGLFFSSEMKTLLVSRNVEYFNAISYKAYEFITGEDTLFNGIKSVLPGEYLEVKSGSITKKSYWKIWENIQPIEDNKNKIISKLSEIVEDSILLRTNNCAHNYGAFISGGLDSALVACIAKPDYLSTAHYAYSDFDELNYAKTVAKYIGKELHIVSPTKEDFIRTREDISYHLDTPCTWTSFTLWRLLEDANAHGMKVMMTGDGADEVFGGYSRYLLLDHDEKIHQIQAMEKYSFMIDRYYGDAAERYARLVNRYSNEYDNNVNSYVVNQVRSHMNHANNNVIHGMGMHDFYTTMQVLLQMGDRMSMAFSIENRSPFLDHRLIEFAFSMPSKYKINNGISKWVLKEVARKFIPREIVDRVDKRGFSAPVNKWFQWDKTGKYDRSGYKQLVFNDWKKKFNVNGAP
jgi:asparagine synthase (glutamine-hydrolysing)